MTEMEAYRRPSTTRSSGIYHTKDDCPRGQCIDNPVPADPNRPGLDKCRWCDGFDMTQPDGRQQSLRAALRESAQD